MPPGGSGMQGPWQQRPEGARLIPTRDYDSDPEAESVGVDMDLPAVGCMDSACRAVLPREHSMELHNDPRFFASNVIEKRLTALHGLAMIASLTTGSAAVQCFRMSRTMGMTDRLTLLDGLEMTGFLMMAAVLFMSLSATIIFLYQTFFTNRLSTAGPTGLELASAYYLHPDVVNWRHIAVRCLGYGLPMIMQSAGILLYVEVCKGDSTFDVVVAGVKLQVHPLALVILTLFTLGAFVLYYLTGAHNRVFKEQYLRRIHPERGQPLLDTAGSYA